MSHFIVIVIGENAEEQLAPYHEFECTGMNDQYVIDKDITEDVLKQAAEDGGDLSSGLEYYGLEDKVIQAASRDLAEEVIDRNGKHQYGYAVVSPAGGLLKAVDRTNPNAKWDWYQIGGRWTGYFRVKAGATARIGEPSLVSSHRAEPNHADICRKGDLDLAGLLKEQIAELDERWKKFHAITTVESRATFLPWSTVREQHGSDTDTARKVYHEQPLIQELNADDDLRWLDNPEDLICAKNTYIEPRKHNNLVPFAYVKDSQWFERGRMGWFACVSDEKDRKSWDAEFLEMFMALPDDTLLTAVDCHI